LSDLAQPRLTVAVSPTCFEADLSARFTELKAKDPGVIPILEKVWGVGVK
jgi:hypothetical protein